MSTAVQVPSSVVEPSTSAAERRSQSPPPLPPWIAFQPSSPRGSPSARTSGHSSSQQQQQDLTQSSTATAAQKQTPVSLPTAVYYGAQRIKVRIDSNVPVSEVIHQLVSSQQLGITEPPALFCLREVHSDQLVTDENLLRLLTNPPNGKAAFKLTNSPIIEAAEMVDKLGTKDEKIVKLATFELKKFVQEQIFIREFISRGGLIELVSVIESSSGNTLAYSLLSMETMMRSESGWENLDEDCLVRIINILATNSLVNVARPAAAILRRLVQAEPARAPPQSPQQQSFRTTIWSYGFARMWPLIQNEPGFWPTVTKMLTMDDQLAVQQVLGLLNALMQGAFLHHAIDFAMELERNKIRQDVLHLCELMGDNEAVIPLINQFQTHLVSLLHMLLNSPVDFEESENSTVLGLAFAETFPEQASQMPDVATQLHMLGFLHNENEYIVDQAFSRTGLLGLNMISSHLRAAKPSARRLIVEHQKRSPERRCHFGAVSNAVLLNLSEIWNISGGSLLSGPRDLLQLLLSYSDTHFLGVKLFYRLWVESQSTIEDFERINLLVGAQLKDCLRNESSKTWPDVERELSNTPYQEIRDRQMSELALEDELLSKAPVRNLRGALYQESFSFVRNQRIGCLMEGAWFQHSVPSAGKEQRRSTQQPKTWRYYRLAANKKHLHFVEAPRPTTIRAGLEDLPERIDLSVVTDIVSAQTVAQAGQKRASPLSPTSQKYPPLPPAVAKAMSTTFSLHTANGVLAELQAVDAETYSEWIDGLSMLKPDGYISTKETADQVQALTDIGVKVKLLDLTGEQVPIPTNVQVASLPASREYHYADI